MDLNDRAQDNREKPAAKEEIKDVADEKLKNCEELESRLREIKEKGNAEFNRKAYLRAIKIFSQAISLYHNSGTSEQSFEMRKQITQLYTNRATSLHMVNEHAKCAADCSYVIE